MTLVQGGSLFGNGLIHPPCLIKLHGYATVMEKKANDVTTGGGAIVGDHQHLTLHKQGREAWNMWRKAHPEIQPLFSGTDLSGTFVGMRDLSHANLRMTMLNGISLVRTDLRYADLSRAHPGDTTLSETDLSGAKFSEANLIGAVLDTVVPTGAIFTDAILSGALLNGADMSEIILNGVLRSRADHTDTGDEHGQETV